MGPELPLGLAAIWLGVSYFVQGLLGGALESTGGLLYLGACLLIIIPGIVYATGHATTPDPDSSSLAPPNWFWYGAAIALAVGASMTTLEIIEVL